MEATIVYSGYIGDNGGAGLGTDDSKDRCDILGWRAWRSKLLDLLGKPKKSP